MAEPISSAAAAKLARIGSAIADGLFGTEDEGRGIKVLFLVLLCFVFFVVFVVAFIPLFLFSMPFATFDELSRYYDTVEAINKRWEKEGIAIPWLEVVALAGVVHEQEFNKITNSHIRSIADGFIEEIEHVDCYTDDEGNATCTTWIEYKLRSMAQVAYELGLSSEEFEVARNYLLALEESGVRPPANWAASPVPGWVWPVPGYDKARDISSGFGFRIHPVTKKPNNHGGVDIVAPTGTRVLAAITGTVVRVGEDEIYGKYVEIENNGHWTMYAHLNAINVSRRQEVEAGNRIGTVGNTGLSTGPHLHFEVKEKRFLMPDKRVNPLKYY